MRKLFILLLALVSAVVFMSHIPKNKYAVILHAGTKSQDGAARALHAFLYASELKDEGYDVVLIFDGAGTTWADELSRPDSGSKILSAYQTFKKDGVEEIVCDYCSAAFGLKQGLQARNYRFEADYKGHPSIAKWVKRGYQLVVL